MNSIFNLLIVANAAWTTLPAEINILETTFAPLNLQATYLLTNYNDIPFSRYPADNQTRIHDSWLNNNILTLATSSDLVAFVTSRNDWKSDDAAGYKHSGQPLITMTSDPEDYWFQEIIQHEIAHAAYEKYGAKDRVHEFVSTYGSYGWQTSFLEDIQRIRRDQYEKDIFSLVKFIEAQSLAGREEGITWAVNRIIEISK